MRGLVAVFMLGMMAVAGCSRESRSPDAIRNDTANATSTAARDAKAVALGVVDGLKRKGPININKASSDELQTLPGISPETADAIVAHRPYQSGGELVRRRLVRKAEYDRIADKIVAR